MTTCNVDGLFLLCAGLKGDKGELGPIGAPGSGKHFLMHGAVTLFF